MKYVALIAAAFLVAGCGARHLNRGTVTSKEHQPARTYTMLLPMLAGETCINTGKSTVCTPRFILIPWVVFDDEDWILHLRDGKRTGIAYVSEQTWKGLSVGDVWNKETEGGALNDPNQKLRRA